MDFKQSKGGAAILGQKKLLFCLAGVDFSLRARSKSSPDGQAGAAEKTLLKLTFSLYNTEGIFQVLTRCSKTFFPSLQIKLIGGLI